MHPVAKSLRLISDEINAVYLEREDAVEAMILALLAREHFFLLGKPGTAKSEMARDFFERFTGSIYFEQLLSRTRPDQAVLGPYDVPTLRDKGEHKRRMDGYMPKSNFAFVDEVGKMSPTLGHDLLPILNERIIHQVEGVNRTTIQVPLYTCGTAANEYIVKQSEDAEALWDRLLVRVVVDHIKDSDNFLKMFMREGNPTGTTTTIDFAELAKAIDNDVPAVVIPRDVGELVTVLMRQIDSLGMEISPRRWRACRKLLKASAFYNGRTEVNEEDIHALRFALWDTIEQIQPVTRLILQVSDALTTAVVAKQEEVQAIRAGLNELRGQAQSLIAKYGLESGGKLTKIQRELDQLRGDFTARNRSTAKLDQVVTDLLSLKDELVAAAMDF